MLGNLGEVDIRQGFFQGESYSLLLFVVSLLPPAHILDDGAPVYHFCKQQTKS